MYVASRFPGTVVIPLMLTGREAKSQNTTTANNLPIPMTPSMEFGGHEKRAEHPVLPFGGNTVCVVREHCVWGQGTLCVVMEAMRMFV